MLEDLRQDLRDAIRVLRRRPALTTTVVMTLMLGIGLNVAAFSVYRAVTMPDVPFDDPAAIVVLQQMDEKPGVQTSIVPATLLDLQEFGDHLFKAVGACWVGNATLSGDIPAQRVRVLRTTPEMFTVFGVRPAAGRPLGAEDVDAGHPVVLISHRMWQSAFEGAPDIIGRQVTLDRETRTVVGVMPERGGFPDARVDVWTPVGWSRATAPTTVNGFLTVVGRLAPGVDAATVELRLGSAFGDRWTEARQGRVRVVDWVENETGRFRSRLVYVQGLALVVLLIGCLNVANLQLAGADSRRHEFAVRAQLGATCGRLLRQSLTESLMLALAAAAAGAVVAVWVTRALIALNPSPPTGATLAEVRWPEVIAALLLASGAAIVFGLAAALRTSRSPLMSADRFITGSGGLHRYRSALIVVEVALSIALLTGAGLLVRSFVGRAGLPLGFRPAGVVTAHLSLPASIYATEADRRAFWQALVDRLESGPSAAVAGVTTAVPFSRIGSTQRFVISGLNSEAATVIVQSRVVSPDYFRTLGMTIVRGHRFDESIRAGGPPVAIVNETFARMLAASGPVLGRELRSSEEPLQVIGVVSDARPGYGWDETWSEVYRPLSQAAPFRTMMLALRPEVAEADGRTMIADAIATLDPHLVAENVLTLEQMVDEDLSYWRFELAQLLGFASLAVLLAVVGVYGVVAHAVQRRLREAAIRVALGARPGQVQNLLMRRSLVGVAVGLGLGAVGAAVLSGWLQAQLLEVGRYDLGTYLSCAAIFAAASGLASWIPTRQLRRIDPVETLRQV